jgi:hypothetical protein
MAPSGGVFFFFFFSPGPSRETRLIDALSLYQVNRDASGARLPLICNVRHENRHVHQAHLPSCSGHVSLLVFCSSVRKIIKNSSKGLR